MCLQRVASKYIVPWSTFMLFVTHAQTLGSTLRKIKHTTADLKVPSLGETTWRVTWNCGNFTVDCRMCFPFLTQNWNIYVLFSLILTKCLLIISLFIQLSLLAYFAINQKCGPGSSVRITTGWTVRDRIPGGRDFPSVQTRPGLQPASCTVGTGSFPGVKCGRGVTLTTHPLLVPRSWNSRAIPLPTLWATPGL